MLFTLVICENSTFKLIVKALPNAARFWFGFLISEYNSNREIRVFFIDQAKPPGVSNIVLKLVLKEWSFPFIRRPLDQYIWSTCSNFIIFFFFKLLGFVKSQFTCSGKFAKLITDHSSGDYSAMEPGTGVNPYLRSQECSRHC